MKRFKKLSPDEQRLFRLYGKLPNKSDLLQNKLKVQPLSFRTRTVNMTDP